MVYLFSHHINIMAALSNNHVVVRETLHYTAPATFSSNASDAYEPILAAAAAAAATAAATATATAAAAAATTNVHNEAAAAATAAASHDCPICLESLLMNQNVDVVVRLKSCQHEFHQNCIQDCLNHHQCCPTCRKPVGEPQGPSPGGSMHIQTIGNHCPGFAANTTTIQITYSIPSGTQKSYQQHPGTRYSGTTRIAYLPNNPEGRHLLSRLKYAFTHGLTFIIGTSLTTHQPNCVVWSSIHHKTSLSGGSHAFPDASYIDNTNESLDALNVPEADQLEPNKRQRQQPRPQRTTTSQAAFVPPAAALVPAAASLPPPPPPAVAAAAAAASSVSFVVCKETVPYNQPRTRLPPGYGTCPGGGTMSIEPIGSLPCPGFSPTTTLIQITYAVPDGIQRSYHDNPGLLFRGTSRVTYLPNNDDGRKLLKRLKFAWTHGWIFTVGTSMTTGKNNVVIWSTVIPHKTSLSGGGPFAFPDANYMTTCNQSLDALQVPPFHACP